MIEPQTLKFLKGLKKNNNKAWFDKHRADFEAARIDFSNFIQLVIDELQKTDPTITGTMAKDCIFRQNRDIRFSKDKTPYKVNFGASIKRGGRKSLYAGYYFQLEPGNSFFGGGMWMPEAPQLKNMRQEIDYNWDEFQNILQATKFKKIYGDLYKGDDMRLSREPKGYEKNNPALEYLRLKSFFADTFLPDEELVKSTLHRKTVEGFKAIQPLLEFINRTIES